MLRRLWEQLAIATNWPILLAVSVLVSIGVITIWADSEVDGHKQLVFCGVAVVSMAAFQLINYQRIGRFAWAFYIFSLMAVGYTLIPGAPRVPVVKGAHAWIDFGFASLQPAELVKLAVILVLSRYLRFRSNYRTFVGLLKPFAIVGIPMLMILKQPDLGTALTFIPALFAMLFCAGAKISHLLSIALLGMMLVPFAWFCGTDVPVLKHFPVIVKQYQRDRVYAMFSKDPAMLRKTGFQINIASIAFGSGGVSGKGLGNIPVGAGVPEAHNDMVFALIGEQFGFFGVAVVLFAYVVLFATGVEIASATRDPFGRLIAVGIVAILAGETFINLMVATGLMPVTGITLPFISSGGSSLLASCMAIGLLLNVGQNRPIVMAKDSFEYD